VNLDAGQEQSDLVVGCNFLFEFLAGTNCKHNYKLETSVKIITKHVINMVIYRRHNTQHNDIEHNDNQRTGTQHSNRKI
jgi:hypothetical protein